jgi:hypothetical protein
VGCDRPKDKTALLSAPESCVTVSMVTSGSETKWPWVWRSWRKDCQVEVQAGCVEVEEGCCVSEEEASEDMAELAEFDGLVVYGFETHTW